MEEKDSKKTKSDDLVNQDKDLNHDELLSIKSYKSFYDFSDFQTIYKFSFHDTFSSRIYDLDRLLEKDKMREKDGFPRKIKLGKLVKPSKDGKDKTIIIPTVSEEKFYHWDAPQGGGEGKSTGGIGGEDEGEVIGEEPIRPSEQGEGQGAGQGDAAEHGMGADAYDIGKILTEQFELPNIKEKGKKTSLTKFSYELTDKNKGHGQLLDKKATLKRVVKTNLSLGRIDAKKKIDTSKMLLTPSDRVYRILSKEKDYESQAVVFFVRDYSGSMQGKPTEAVVTQHIYINSWLIYQYKRQVKSRFIVHDQQAIEVPDFYTYYNKNVAGGTEVSSAYELVNKIIEEESLARDYNIYIFHGTDGDDWDQKGTKTIENIQKMISHTNRIGITVAENTYTQRNNSVVEKYIKESKLLEKHPEIIHFDSFKAVDADESRIIQSIKLLIS